MSRQFQKALLFAATSALIASCGSAAAQDQAPGSMTPQAVPHVTRQVPCGDRKEIARVLDESFGEKPVAHGLADSGMLAEIFSSPQGTWTIIATTPDGTSCLIGSGKSFQTTAALDNSI